MDLFAHIDHYCERTDASLWSEPLNAVSNLGFIIVGILLWHRFRKHDVEFRALAVLVVGIGFCSGLFHVSGTRWGMLLDVGGIALFILAYVHRYLRRIAGLPVWACGCGVVAFVVADRLIASLGSLGLNGSEGYLLPAAILCVMSLVARYRARLAVPWLGGATLLFVTSLSLRTLDMPLCGTWPLGTHFAWHLLNAAVLYCCVQGLAAGTVSRT